MNIFSALLIAAVVFGACRIIDILFTNAFRNKAQHRSGTALSLGGAVVLIMGICLSVYYLTHGIFYDGESFLVASFRKEDRVYQFEQIKEQKLYLVQGGSVIIELYMDDDTSVSLQSSMDGVYLFLDTAFAAWCLQKGIDPQTCDFHDPSKSWWFPHEEEE